MLCQTAIVYSRKIDDTIYTFGHEGMLYRASFVMYDKQTNSLWVHTTGEAVKGPSKGKVLTFLPSTVTSWKRWRKLHPETSVLTGARARGRMGNFDFAKRPDNYGLSIGQGASPKLYPFEILMKERVLNDQHEDRPVVLVYDTESGTARAYERGSHTFIWKDGAVIDESGRAWDMLRGVPTSGSPERLTQVPATAWLIKRWQGFHPRAATHSAPITD